MTLGFSPGTVFTLQVQTFRIQARPRASRGDSKAWRDTLHARAVELEAFDLVEVLQSDRLYVDFDFRVVREFRDRT